MTYLIRNEDIKQVLIGVPKGHKHLRICLKLKGKAIIFQEATIANILRGYVTVKTHPKVGALQLEMKALLENQMKEGYAKHQLLEVQRKEDEIEEEIQKLLETARPF